MVPETATVFHDPVCGMTVESDALTLQHGGRRYRFCSPSCLKRFQASPEQYLRQSPENAAMPSTAPHTMQQLLPLLAILSGIAAIVIVKQLWTGGWDLMSAAHDFMGVFFLVFGGFKLLDWNGFVDAYGTYDILASKSRVYGRLYPLIELALGAAYLLRWNLFWVNWATLIVMSIGSIGVVKALRSGRRIQCACLGTKIKLPMTVVTLTEDVVMAGMALGMLVGGR